MAGRIPSAGPRIGSVWFAVCTNGVAPLDPEREYELLNKPGRRSQSVLLHAPRNNPQEVVMVAGLPGINAAVAFKNSAYQLEGQLVEVDDGLAIYDNALVIAVRSEIRDAGVVLGPGITPGSTHEVVITALILPQD